MLNNVVIPHVDKAPVLEEFLEMKPSAAWAGKLAEVSQFTQRDPKDGQPALSKTVVYLGYDDKNFYTVFVCFDDQPGTIRSRMARRDTIGPDDDEVQIYLDTFYDKNRAYGFMTNPRGIQFDYIWTEANGYDNSFDTIWNAEGHVTKQGWVALFAVPFKSLRFSTKPEQTWGLLLQRVVPRTSENLFWPQNTKSISGRLNQEGTVSGVSKISPGRNIQIIPYVAGRSFRAPDLRDPNNLQFGGAHFRGTGGVDAKMVIKDSFVLDATLNPDFGQVESDEPQVTVNQRFEVFFPEKRPFFLENASYFDTPITLLFTRRIVEPKFGARFTGKKGPYQVGILFADDVSPGRNVPDSDPLHGKRAYFGIARFSRDIFKQGHIGFMYTEREFEGSFNRVGGFDAHLKFGDKWTLDGQAVASQTKNLDDTTQAGPSYQLYVDRSSKKSDVNSMYIDTGQGFHTEPGFFRRPSIRRFSNYANYRFRPEGKHLLNHGPSMFTENIWDRTGLRLTEFVNVNYQFNFIRETTIGAFVQGGHERLRPFDFSTLPSNQDYRSGRQGIFFGSFYFPKLSFFGELGNGTALNFVPVPGLPPVVADMNYANLFLTVKPMTALTIDNTYFLTHLLDRNTGHSSFTNHIIRSKWNYQFTKSLSLRFIMQYNTLLGNPNYTSLATNKGLNTDVLVTWLLHPGTAVYVGYNTNMANPDPTYMGLNPAPNRFINDSRGLFIKASYLFRF